MTRNRTLRLVTVHACVRIRTRRDRHRRRVAARRLDHASRKRRFIHVHRCRTFRKTRKAVIAACVRRHRLRVAQRIRDHHVHARQVRFAHVLRSVAVAVHEQMTRNRTLRLVTDIRGCRIGSVIHCYGLCAVCSGFHMACGQRGLINIRRSGTNRHVGGIISARIGGYRLGARRGICDQNIDADQIWLAAILDSVAIQIDKEMARNRTLELIPNWGGGCAATRGNCHCLRIVCRGQNRTRQRPDFTHVGGYIASSHGRGIIAVAVCCYRLENTEFIGHQYAGSHDIRLARVLGSIAIQVFKHMTRNSASRLIAIDTGVSIATARNIYCRRI